MGDRGIGNRLDLLDPEHSQIGKPLVIFKQGIMIRAHPSWKGLPGNGMVEHPASRYVVDVCPAEMLDIIPLNA